MSAEIVRHEEMKLIGIPCVGLNRMGDKFQLAKESLLAVASHLPGIVNPQTHYGIHPQRTSQDHPETHVFILCVQVTSFEGIPEWFFRTTLPAHACIVAYDNEGMFDGAGEKIDVYKKANQIAVSASGFDFTIGERYDYEGAGYARYSLPIARSDQT